MNLAKDAPADLFITQALYRRPAPRRDYRRELHAIQELAFLSTEAPDSLLAKFVDFALTFTEGDSAGISVYEPLPSPGFFRWQFLRGALARFENTIVPRHWSPCGVALDKRTPMLTRHPERVYGWIRPALELPEVLLFPLEVTREFPMGTLWIVSEREGHFHRRHVEAILELRAYIRTALLLHSVKQRDWH